MDKPLQSLDWSMVEVFLAVAESGSLSGAARKLGTSQPTVGRQVRDIEERLGTTLFLREPRGMSLSETGAALLEPAHMMREAAGRFANIAAGAGEAVSGTVRITASDFISHYIMPRIIAAIRLSEPDISIDLVATDHTNNLLFREADIAVRMFRPTQLDLITKHVGDMPIALFGAKAYLDRVGRPKTVEDLMDHEWVGYDKDPRMIEGFREAGWPVERAFFRTRCDHHPILWEFVRAGCGLGFVQRPYAAREPLVEEVPISVQLPTLEVWLTAHAALRGTPRIRRVWTLLAQHLRRYVE
ncbi:MAG: LysR family transcriptional regulator [Pseudomonadota bacterium]